MTPDVGNSIEYVWSRPWPWSVWLTVAVGLCLVGGVVALYWNERGQASKTWRGTLAGLRIGAILLVTWMLAGWSIERYQSDMPELVVILDDSASMQTTDAVAGSTVNRSGLSRWDLAVQLLSRAWTVDIERAGAQYRPKLYAMSDDVRPLSSNWSEMETIVGQIKSEGLHSRLGDGLIHVMQRQSGRPTAAIVLMSDGIVTGGAPLEEALPMARRLNVPIICIATGQQLPQPDLALMDLLADDAVYLGDRVNIQVTVSATDIERIAPR